MNIDIAGLLEIHRQHMLKHTSALYDEGEGEEAGHALSAMASAHDRASAKTWAEVYRQGQTGNGQQPVGSATALGALAGGVGHTATASRKVKVGSKAARQRALKAGETRRKNLADKEAAAAAISEAAKMARDYTAKGIAGASAGEPPLSPATHLAPRTPEGGAA